MEANTPMAKLGDFFGGGARGYDPSRPSNMVSSISAGTTAMGDRQDPEAVKAQAEAEALEGSLKTKQAMASLSASYLKALKDLSTSIDSTDMGRLESLVHKSFGYTIGLDGNLRGIGGKAIKEEDQMKVNKKLLDAGNKFKTGGFQAVLELLATDGKPKPNSNTIIGNKSIQDKINKAQEGQ